MKQRNSIFDRYLARTDEVYDDEFQRDIYYRSAMISLPIIAILSTLSFAIICWVAPQQYAYIWGVSTLLPWMIGISIPARWATKRAGRPALRLSRLWQPDALLQEALLLAGFVGIAYRGFTSGNDEYASFGTGTLTGGIASGVATLVLLPIIWKRMRKKDQQRLDREADQIENKLH